MNQSSVPQNSTGLFRVKLFRSQTEAGQAACQPSPEHQTPLTLSPHPKSPCEVHQMLPFKQSAEKPTQAKGGRNSGDQPTAASDTFSFRKEARSYGGQTHNASKSGSGD